MRELARAYGIHHTTVSAHVARSGKTRGQLSEAQVDEAVGLFEWRRWESNPRDVPADAILQQGAARLLFMETVGIEPTSATA